MIWYILKCLSTFAFNICKWEGSQWTLEKRIFLAGLKDWCTLVIFLTVLTSWPNHVATTKSFTWYIYNFYTIENIIQVSFSSLILSPLQKEWGFNLMKLNFCWWVYIFDTASPTMFFVKNEKCIPQKTMIDMQIENISCDAYAISVCEIFRNWFED